ncbi:MAG: hypothetical protein ACI8RA_001714, partial [Chlamydiales bacterium]
DIMLAVRESSNKEIQDLWDKLDDADWDSLHSTYEDFLQFDEKERAVMLMEKMGVTLLAFIKFAKESPKIQTGPVKKAFVMGNFKALFGLSQKAFPGLQDCLKEETLSHGIPFEGMEDFLQNILIPQVDEAVEQSCLILAEQEANAEK